MLDESLYRLYLSFNMSHPTCKSIHSFIRCQIVIVPIFFVIPIFRSFLNLSFFLFLLYTFFGLLAFSFSRSSRPVVFCKKSVLRNFIKFTGKHLCQSLFFNKVAGFRPATLLKKGLWHRCFPVNFAKFLR